MSRSPVVRWSGGPVDTGDGIYLHLMTMTWRPSPGLTRLNFQEVVVWPSHVRLSIHPPSALFGTCARSRHALARRPFFSSLSASIFNSWPFMHSLLVDALLRDCFAHRPIDWLAHNICSDHLLLLPSSVSLDCFVEFRTCAIASSRSFRLRHQTDEESPKK